MVIGSDGPRFGSRLWQLLELFNPHQDFSNLISGEFNERMYAYTYHCSSPSIRPFIIPYLIYQYLCVLCLSRQSAWNKASFQNLLYISPYDFPPSFLAYNFHYYGRYEEYNHKPNTVVVTALEASWSNYFTVGYINTNSDRSCAGKQCRVAWENHRVNLF